MIKNKRKLLIWGLSVGVSLLALAALAIFELGLVGCQDELWVSIGTFQSTDSAMRAAIQRLAVETQRCPKAQFYHIIWKGPYSDDPDKKQNYEYALLYCARPRALGVEHDVGSGISGKCYTVDLDAIKAVAEKGGTLE